MQSSQTSSISIDPITLTNEAFQAFGSIITSPLPSTTTHVPHPPPQGTILANQNTAIKSSSLIPISSTYHLSPSGIPAKPVMSQFSCFPRTLRQTTTKDGKTAHVFDVKILERHPYTTQTFVPLSHNTSSSTNDDRTRCIIIVAPTLPTPPVLSSGTPYFPQASSSSYKSTYGGAPDLQNLKAFVAEPGVGITYGVGTWHAPMVVVGDGRVDFVVTQWMSGRSEEDCQEVELGDGVYVVIEEERLKERAKL